jgi:hypothetical protein
MSYGLRPDNPRAVNVDLTGRLEVIQTEHQAIHRGKMYLFSDVQTVGSGATYKWLITTPGDKLNKVNALIRVRGSAGHTVTISETPTAVSGGTAKISMNKNRYRADASPVTFKYGVTATTGTILQKWQAGNSGTSPQAGGVPDLNRGEEWVLGANKNYLVEVASTEDGQSITIEVEYYQNPLGD